MAEQIGQDRCIADVAPVHRALCRIRSVEDSLRESMPLHALDKQATPARYRTTNWSGYTASLRRRGSLLIWVDKEMTWLAPRDGRPGRPAVFSDAAIQFCLSIKALFKLPLRQTAEIHIRIALMNRFNALGTAEIVRVA